MKKAVPSSMIMFKIPHSSLNSNDQGGKLENEGCPCHEVVVSPLPWLFLVPLETP